MYNDVIDVRKNGRCVQSLFGRSQNSDERVNLLLLLDEEFDVEVEMISDGSKRIDTSKNDSAKFMAALFLAPVPRPFYLAHRIGYLAQHLGCTRDILSNCPSISDKIVKSILEQLASTGVISLDCQNQKWKSIIDFSSQESAPTGIKNSIGEFFK